jgi:hypothetical protein
MAQWHEPVEQTFLTVCFFKSRRKDRQECLSYRRATKTGELSYPQPNQNFSCHLSRRCVS